VEFRSVDIPLRGFMTDIASITFFLASVLIAAIPLGWWLHTILFAFPERGLLFRLDAWLSTLLVGKRDSGGHSWRQYLGGVLAFNLIGLLALFFMLLLQPLWARGLPAIPWHGALNIAASFVTNTNWQWYAGEVTLHPATQALGLGVQNFLSAACGLAVFAALTRSLMAWTHCGNLWDDVRRSIVFLLLPASLVLACVFVAQGIPQTIDAWMFHDASPQAQNVPLGPVASQVAIKQLGSNGGGFYNVNSSHPLENPTWVTNALQQWALLALPAACVIAFGMALKKPRHGAAIAAAMSVMFVAGAVVMAAGEGQFGSMEGKDVRIGTASSIIWAAATTSASNGSVNAMHSSLTPLAGAVAMANMATGEVIFGGIGSGMYGMVMYVVLTVFLCGLMIGRTPEYQGVKLTANVMWPVVVALLLPTFIIILLVCLAIMVPGASAAVSTTGPHALSEIIYAVLSAVGNNGSAFAGLAAGGPEWTSITTAGMLLGRFGVIVPVMMFAGRAAKAASHQQRSVQLSTEGPLFVTLLIGTIVLVGVLTAAPMFVLGPGADYLLQVVHQ
jgi:K+-transporting ATPase ATPase A chain